MLDTRPPTAVLVCPRTGPVPSPDTRQVDSAGATLSSGGNLLIIPPNAIPGNATRTITFETRNSDTVGVVISPPGHFQSTSATLVLDLSRCSSSTLAGQPRWNVWRMRGNQSNRLLSIVDTTSRLAAAMIDSTSAFSIAN